GLSGDLVQADGVDQELGTDQHSQLARIQLRDKYLPVIAQNAAKVCGKGIQIVQLRSRNGETPPLRPLYRMVNCTEGATPAKHQQFAFRRTKHRQLRDVAGDALDLVDSQLHHALVICGVVADLATDLLLLEATKA